MSVKDGTSKTNKVSILESLGKYSFKKLLMNWKWARQQQKLIGKKSQPSAPRLFPSGF